MERHMDDLPLIDRVKIQAEVLVPLLRAMERTMGKEAADALSPRAHWGRMARARPPARRRATAAPPVR